MGVGGTSQLLTRRIDWQTYSQNAGSTFKIVTYGHVGEKLGPGLRRDEMGSKDNY
jgi:hypothetical protein